MKFKKKPTKQFLSLFTIVAIIIVSLFSFYFGYYSKKQNVESLSYNKFISLVEKNDIKKVILSKNNATFVAENKNGTMYTVPNPKYSNFKKDLLKKDVQVKEFNFNLSSLINLTFLLLCAFSIINFKGSLFSDNTSKSISSENIPDVKLDDVAGNDELKKEIKNIIDFMKNPKKYTEKGAKLPKGLLLYGPPGTGKTLIAKAIAGESNIPFFNVCGSDFIEMFVGVGAKRVRKLFAEARKKAPCIIFIDEFDALGSKRTVNTGDSEKRQTINAILSEMDGFNSSDNILVIGATNMIEDLDSALIRAGRFDKHIMIPLPEKSERLEILKKYAKNKKLSDEISLEQLAKETINFSGADIENLLNEASFICATKDKDIIDKEDIDDAFFKILLKGNKKSKKDRLQEENQLVAYHEAGHTIAHLLLPNSDEVSKVTIIPSSSGAGGVTISTPSKMGLYSKEYLLEKVKILYAGRIGELLFLDNNTGKITTGASQDIKTATSILNDIIRTYGMHDKYGMINLDVLKVDNNEILKEISKLSIKLYDETLQLLTKNKDLLFKIANELINKETLSNEDLKTIVNEYKIQIK